MTNQKIKIIDTGLGNISSISKCIQFLNFEYEIVSNPSLIEEDCKIIFPGVGSFNHAMKVLNSKGWTQSLRYQVLEKKKMFLGICLGMQLMATNGYENNIKCEGLNFINSEVLSLKEIGCKLKVPHTGWNGLNIKNKSKILNDISPISDFYFNHSYVVIPKDKDLVLTNTIHEVQFASIINFENIYGIQFHPEKSSEAGKTLLRNFLSI
jgi:glutamine amidotransferase